MREQITDKLNSLLANEYVVFTKTLNYHWNVVGARFYPIHVFLGDQYKELLSMMDELAERIRFLNGHPMGTVQEMEHAASVPEQPGHFPSITQMLSELCDGHERIDQQIQSILNEGLSDDAVTEDLLIQLQGKHQTMIWMLRSHYVSEPTSLKEEEKSHGLSSLI